MIYNLTILSIIQLIKEGETMTLTTKSKAKGKDKEDLLFEGQDKITDKQMKFTEFHYLDELPIKEAAMKAGYSSSTRWNNILKYVYVQNYRKALNDNTVQRSYSLEDDDVTKSTESEASKSLSKKQRLFADEYIMSGNITQSAIKAGYSESYADKSGYKLLGINGMREYLEERNAELDKDKIADMEEVHEFWANILRDEELDVSDRIRVSELIGKTNGAFLSRVEQTGDMKIKVEWTNDD